MKPIEAFSDDLVDYVGRIREELYPELSNSAVAIVLRRLCSAMAQTDGQAKAKAWAELQMNLARQREAIEIREPAPIAGSVETARSIFQDALQAIGGKRS